jgi:hypothetical protein
VGKRWTDRDRYGNNIYLTNETRHKKARPANHPEMSDFETHLKKTIILSLHIKKK